jgi:predicted RNA polymerase sigma factor
VALNCAVALGKARGLKQGLAAMDEILDSTKLKDNPFYPAAQGEFHMLEGHRAEACFSFEKALRLARSPAEAQFLEHKLAASMEIRALRLAEELQLTLRFFEHPHRILSE